MSVETYSIIAEQSLLGGLIAEAWRIDDLPCSAADFYRHDHKTIFEAMQRMVESGKQVDTITLAEDLESRGELESVGGLSYIVDILQTSPGAGNVRSYAQAIKDKALIRSLISTCNEVIDRALKSSETPADQVAQAEAEIYAIMDQRDTSEPVDISIAVREAHEYLNDKLEGKSFLPTGLDDLDHLLGGLHGGSLYIIAARSSMGKTGLLCTVASNIASAGKRCFIATLEMPRREIAARLTGINGGLDLSNIKQWEDYKFSALSHAMVNVKELPIIIDEQSGLTIGQLRSRVRREKRKKGLACVFVDYLQLMRAKAESREREIATISAGLKSIAKEFDVPVIALSQLNRSVEGRGDKRPVMSDLRESGSIEQDADAIIFVYRDDYYNKDSAFKGMAELLLRKNRHGPTGEVYTVFHGPTMHFRNKASDWMLPDAEVPTKGRKRGYDAIDD